MKNRARGFYTKGPSKIVHEFCSFVDVYFARVALFYFGSRILYYYADSSGPIVTTILKLSSPLPVLHGPKLKPNRTW